VGFCGIEVEVPGHLLGEENGRQQIFDAFGGAFPYLVMDMNHHVTRLPVRDLKAFRLKGAVENNLKNKTVRLLHLHFCHPTVINDRSPLDLRQGSHCIRELEEIHGVRTDASNLTKCLLENKTERARDLGFWGPSVLTRKFLFLLSKVLSSPYNP